LFKLLLSHGADPNALDNWNYTPLHESAIKGKLDVCVVLLQNGADSQIRNSDGKTAVELADASAKVLRALHSRVLMLMQTSGIS